MRKTTIIWLVVAAALLVVGDAVFTAALAAANWDFAKFTNGSYETNTYQVSEEFYCISMKTHTADIRSVPSGDETCAVVCQESEKIRYNVAAENGVLTIQVLDERTWYEYIGINLATQLTVRLPKEEYAALVIREDTGAIELPEDFTFETVDIRTSTGQVKSFASASESMKLTTSTGLIHVENVSVGQLELSVSTGSVTVTNVVCQGDLTVNVTTGKVSIVDTKCNNLISTGATGGVSLKNMIAAGKLSVERSTGDVKLDGCDAGEIFIKTDTGDVRGSLLSGKVFVAHTDTGKVTVPAGTTGGLCEITTDTGDIQIKIQ